VQFLQGGLQISLITCIDFTASNGDPDMPNSLHAVNSGGLNQYQRAIRSVGDILINYDHTNLVPVYGFGGKTMFNRIQNPTVSHFFPCSGDINNCAGKGIEGVFGLYQYALQNVILSGPTYFSPLLEEVINYTKSKAAMNPLNYTVLLILTDGVIHDMDATISQIVKASSLPMSVIIVGVGTEDFGMMDRLDSDNAVYLKNNL